MRNFYDQFTDSTAPKGLYRIWVRSDDRDSAALVARWIDPRLEGKATVKEGEDKDFPLYEEFCLYQERPEMQLGTRLKLALIGAF